MTRFLNLVHNLLEWLQLDRLVAVIAGRGKAEPIEISNPRQNLMTRFTGTGIEVSPLRPRPGMSDWRLSLETRGLGRSGRIRGLFRPRREQDENRVIFHHRGGLTETFESLATGIEQGFVLERRPLGRGEVTIVIRVTTDLAPYTGTTKRYVRFTDERGAPVLSFDRAVVRDANGTRLTSSVELIDGELRMRFLDEGAEYPVRLSPPPVPEPPTVMPGHEAAPAIKARSWSLPAVS